MRRKITTLSVTRLSRVNDALPVVCLKRLSPSDCPLKIAEKELNEEGEVRGKGEKEITMLSVARLGRVDEASLGVNYLHLGDYMSL